MSAHSHADFEEFYADGERWSGAPNEGLVREITGLAPGTALDIGSGEGADVVWLAEQGWQATGVDPIAVAVERAQELIDARGVTAELITASLVEIAATGRTFDLVSCFYAPLATADAEDIARLVAPGGTLLFVHHDLVETKPEILLPEELRDLIGEQFSRVSLTRTARAVSHGAGAHHHEDLVLRATRA